MEEIFVLVLGGGGGHAAGGCLCGVREEGGVSECFSLGINFHDGEFAGGRSMM